MRASLCWKTQMSTCIIFFLGVGGCIMVVVYSTVSVRTGRNTSDAGNPSASENKFLVLLMLKPWDLAAIEEHARGCR